MFIQSLIAATETPLIDSSVGYLLITGIIIPLAIALMRKMNLNPPGPPVGYDEGSAEAPAATKTTPPSTPAVPGGTTGPEKDLISMIPALWSRVAELEKKEDDWQKERSEIISHSKMLMETNATLGRGLYTFFSWIDEGAKPPPPEVPDELKNIVRLIVEKVDQENLK